MSSAQWTPLAKADLAAVDAYYASRDPDFADRVGQAAVAAASFLAEFPLAGVVVPPDHRKWNVAATPYILLYRPTAEGVEILRVHHQRQDWRGR